MNILTTILNYCKTPEGQRNFLIVCVIILVIFFRGCGTGNNIDDIMYKQNIAALNDSIRTYKTTNGKVISEKLALLVKHNKLKQLNSELAKEVKYLKDNPITITKIEYVVQHDTTEIPVYIDTSKTIYLRDSTAVKLFADWNFDTTYSLGNYRKLSGDFNVIADTGLNIDLTNFRISNDVIGLSLITGITESDKDMIEIFVRSDYPGFKATKIEGAFFDPRKSKVIRKFFPPKKWSLSVYCGYGIYFDPFNVSFGTGVQLGAGFTYNIVGWNFKNKRK